MLNNEVPAEGMQAQRLKLSKEEAHLIGTMLYKRARQAMSLR
jgi:hypothetical protein